MKQKYKRYISYIKKNSWKFMLLLGTAFAISLYIFGVLKQSTGMLTNGVTKIDYNIIHCLLYGLRSFSFNTLLLFFILSGFGIYFWVFRGGGIVQGEDGYTISEKVDSGSAKWMPPEEQEEVFKIDTVEETLGNILGSTDDGKFVYSYSPKDPYRKSNDHKAVIGGSGRRKTRSMSVPDIMQAIRRGESFLTTDPKGEVTGLLYELCKAEGYEVRILNTINPKYSDGCDFMQVVKGEPLNAARLANVIINNTTTQEGFWTDTQELLLTGTILYVDSANCREAHSLTTVYKLFSLSADELSAIFEALPENHPARSYVDSFVSGPSNVKPNVMYGLQSRLKAIGSPDVKNMLSADEIDFALPGKKKCAYFICPSDQESTLDFICAMFFSCAFFTLVAQADANPSLRLDITTNMILDEFPNIATIPDFGKKLNTVRSRGINITIIFQDLSQMMREYVADWSSIVSACEVLVFLGSSETEYTIPFMERYLGEATIDVEVEGSQKNALFKNRPSLMVTQQNRTSKRSLNTQDEIRRLNNNQVFVILGKERPIKLRKFDRSEHFMNKRIELINISEHVPQWKKVMDDALNMPANNKNGTKIRETEALKRPIQEELQRPIPPEVKPNVHKQPNATTTQKSRKQPSKENVPDVPLSLNEAREINQDAFFDKKVKPKKISQF